MAKQTTNGKAFEYALLNEFSERLKQVTQVTVIKNDIFNNALNCFETFSQKEKDAYSLNASFAVNFLLDIEPRLSNHINQDDILELEIVADKVGQSGDVRDVLAIRSSQQWEIGISAKTTIVQLNILGFLMILTLEKSGLGLVHLLITLPQFSQFLII